MNSLKKLIIIAIAFLFCLSSSAIAAKLDPTTGAQLTILNSHYEIHEGDHFFYTDTNLNISSGSSIDYQLTVPNSTKRTHFIFLVEGSLQITIDLYEDGDRVGTVLQTFNNNNRDSSNIAGTILYKGTSGGTIDGTDLHPWISGSGTGGGRLGEVRNEEEIILKTNSKYILRITSGANSNDISVSILIYEHTPVD